MAPLVDAHCHLSWNCSLAPNALSSDHLRCVMSTNPNDWETLKKVEGVRKCFGVHPWYCHLFSFDENLDKRSHYAKVLEWKDDTEFESILSVLPEPVLLESYISQEFDPQIDAIGEIGLDKLFRLPQNGLYIKSSPLSRIRVSMSHQLAVFRRFCQLARTEGKPVSVHGVKCHGLLYDVCSQELMAYNINVCLHSVTASKETLKRWIKHYNKRIFFSLSQCINFKDPAAGRELVQMLPQECILTETDFPLDKYKNSELVQQLQYICGQIEIALDSSIDVPQLIYTNFCRYIESS
ncbi:YMR262W [Zygosaccharomyces parabailii]|uniref:ZYBA0S04-06832g1_1 n=1 Tax=Zygosaccharomyces bailii (strain CLIB 213 / ATCC 58445 / CBS 680 / BCRC 21525 / NBRC 1098 / NCYC 1416 / NRRL Y-2227) TaxID=1333698 RepID=A0A8J2T756_ZYGB2|nr:YMR262W [Zygosaccharomyces parabailii]CDF89543.1 ZYBA0S04-06832g1_1 [Zygosaccharomyces bailii CLIB 213]